MYSHPDKHHPRKPHFLHTKVLGSLLNSENFWFLCWAERVEPWRKGYCVSAAFENPLHGISCAFYPFNMGRLHISPQTPHPYIVRIWRASFFPSNILWARVYVYVGVEAGSLQWVWGWKGVVWKAFAWNQSSYVCSRNTYIHIYPVVAGREIREDVWGVCCLVCCLFPNNFRKYRKHAKLTSEGLGRSHVS